MTIATTRCIKPLQTRSGDAANSGRLGLEMILGGDRRCPSPPSSPLPRPLAGDGEFSERALYFPLAVSKPGEEFESTMEIDEPADLECVEDDFEEGAHEKLDKEIHECFSVTPENFHVISGTFLATIIRRSRSGLLSKYHSISECETIIEREPRLRNMLLDGPKNGYKSVRLSRTDLSVSSDCTSNDLIVELLRPSECRSRSRGNHTNIEISKNLFSRTTSISSAHHAMRCLFNLRHFIHFFT